MSIFRSRSDAQPSKPEPSPEVQRLLAEAREDYLKHNSPATQAAAREQLGQARTNGNASAYGR